MWLSLVERCVRDAEAASSNLVIPTITDSHKPNDCPFIFLFKNNDFLEQVEIPALLVDPII